MQLGSRPLSGGMGDVVTVVLVEGVSDQRAVQTLATRAGRDLHAEGIAVVPMGGATNIGRFLELLGPPGAGPILAGLCDAREADAFRRALARAGFGSVDGGPDLEQRGFFVCDTDLEDELIRALGVAAVEQVVEDAGEVGSLLTFRQQPAQRDRTPEQQLHRFLGTRAGRKIRYAGLLVDALDPARIPPPLERLLAYV